MSKKENFRELSLDEKVAKRVTLMRKLREHRFTAIIGKVENPMEKRHLRRSIARLNTLIHEQKKGS
jgi:large subunit ribosomal protein L29